MTKSLKGWPDLDNIGKRKQKIPEYFQAYHDFLHSSATPIVGELYKSVVGINTGLSQKGCLMLVDVKRGHPDKIGIPRDCGYMSPNGKTYEIDWIDRNQNIEVMSLTFLDLEENTKVNIAVDSAMFNIIFSLVSLDDDAAL